MPAKSGVSRTNPRLARISATLRGGVLQIRPEVISLFPNDAGEALARKKMVVADRKLEEEISLRKGFVRLIAD
jgi:hypothetical protein